MLPFTLHLNLPFRSICPVSFYDLVVSSWLCHFELSLIFFSLHPINWAFVSYVQLLGVFAGSQRFCALDLVHMSHTHTMAHLFHNCISWMWKAAFHGLNSLHLYREMSLMQRICRREGIRSRNWVTFLFKLDWAGQVWQGESNQGHLRSHQGQSCRAGGAGKSTTKLPNN